MKTIKHTLIALFLAVGLAAPVLADMSPVDLNTATAEELADALTGVGLARAEAIVAYRDENGGFEHIDELVNVRGIGLATVDRNRDRMTISESRRD